MPSYAELQAEPWWSREIVTTELDWLGDEICRRTGRLRDAFGTKGNNVHLSGGHRSQEWILNSDWCTNTSYTVQSGLSADQLRHIGAADFTPAAWGTAANRALVAAQTKRLWDAAKRGELAGLRQILGTLDGRNPIGLNVVSGSIAYPDSSHLDHWHLTFDRKHMRDIGLMRRILTVVIGDDMPSGLDWSAAWIAQRIIEDADEIVIPANAELGYAGFRAPNLLKRRLVGLESKVDGLVSPPPATVDIAALVAALRPELEAAAERAVRKVLGAVDEATPQP